MKDLDTTNRSSRMQDSMSRQSVVTASHTQAVRAEKIDRAQAEGNSFLARDDHGRRALRAGAFVIGGYGLSQVIRLGGNLILTRLLVPEMFAVMAIAQVFYLGIGLLSDIGLEPAIIRSARADDRSFLNTAWTLQVIRGFGLWLLALGVAYPVSNFYGEAILLRIIPILGLNSILGGFKSTSLVTLNKELRQGVLTVMEISIQIAGLVTMALLAYFYRSVWSLVAGSLVATSMRTVWSHLLRSPARNRFAFERAASRELLRFGKWIFFSTAMMFLATQADRLLLGRLFPLAFFGVYSIAAGLAEMPKQVMDRLAGKVIYPLFTKNAHLGRDEMRTRISRQRALLVYPLAGLVGLFASFSDLFVLTLYDSRYEQAAWILPLLAIGMWPLILYGTIDRSLYVVGKPSYSAAGNLVKFVYMIVATPLMFRFLGTVGAVAAVALNDLPVYALVGYGLKRERLALFKQDAFATTVLLVTLALSFALRSVLGLHLPTFGGARW